MFNILFSRAPLVDFWWFLGHRTARVATTKCTAMYFPSRGNIPGPELPMLWNGAVNGWTDGKMDDSWDKNGEYDIYIYNDNNNKMCVYIISIYMIIYDVWNNSPTRSNFVGLQTHWNTSKWPLKTWATWWLAITLWEQSHVDLQNPLESATYNATGVSRVVCELAQTCCLKFHLLLLKNYLNDLPSYHFG